MLQLDRHMKLTLLIYLFICIALYYLKPAMMFSPNGGFKKFGFGDKRYNTVFPYWLVTTMMGFMVFYIILTCNSDYL
jgi:hypothetical protein